MSRFANSWRLVEASAAVLRSDKELIIFPIVSGVLSVIVTLTFIAPVVFAQLFDWLFNEGRVFGFIVLFLFYLVQSIVITYCNAALVGAALIRLRGGDPTVGDGFRIASERLGVIFGYALIAATVGVVLQAIRERSEWLGRIVVAIIGAAWSLITYLVVPVLVIENIGPIEAVKRSAVLLKRTWGEQIIANAGIGLVFGLIWFAVLLLGIPIVIIAFAFEVMALGITAVVLLVVALTVVGLISAALKGIYTAALYRYAADGEVGSFFDADLIQHAFRPK